jgi:predicted amidohydrolase
MAKIGFYQFSPRFGEVDHNLAQVVAALRGADADLIVLPELAFTGYYFSGREELRRLAEDPNDSATVDTLVALCRERDFFLVAGFAERRLDRLFNSALLIGPHGIVRTYRKLHLFGSEQDCFDPGDTPLQVDEVRGMRVGMMICFDWAFPEAARTLMLQGADVICHPSNLVLTYCQGAMVVRCIENLLFAVTANRYGTERRPHGELSFTGQSQIVAPRGELLHRSPPDRDDLHLVEVDVTLARDKGIGVRGQHMGARNDVVRDRRPDFYRELCRHGGDA